MSQQEQEQKTETSDKNLPGVSVSFELNRQQQRRQDKAERDIGDRSIPKDQLQKFTQPLKNALKFFAVGTFLYFAVTALPTSRWRWYQRTLFRKYCNGKAIDLMPIVGEETRITLLSFSNASTIHLAGKKSKRAQELSEPRGKSGGSMSYAVDDAEAREQEAAEGNEECQDVSIEMLREATSPDTLLGVQENIKYIAQDIETAEKASYDTAFMTDAMCWESPQEGQARLLRGWSLVKPGGHFMLIDYGRPKYSWLGKLVDKLDEQKLLSLRLTTDYGEMMKETLGEEAVWPPIVNRRTMLGFRHVLVVEKKKTEDEK